MNTRDRLKLAAILTSERIGAKQLTRLLQGLGSAAAIWQASQSVLSRHVPESAAQGVVEARETVDLEWLAAAIERVKARMIMESDTEYPILLKEVSDRPVMLFVRGDATLLSRPAVAVVGARQSTSYGLRIAEELGVTLAQTGLVVVSGLALGIDAAAHRAALSSGATVAVLGCGIDQIYPSSHQRLGEELLDRGGAIVSEYPPGVAPFKQHFPARNRIIAGLSRGVVVVEAMVDSGALITAELALDYNREVWAIPHDLDRQSGAGCLKLIRSGATLIRGAEDIIEALGYRSSEQAAEPLQLGKAEQQVLALLSDGDSEVDELAARSALSVGELSAALTSLELAGMVRLSGTTRYSRKRSHRD